MKERRTAVFNHLNWEAVAFLTLYILLPDYFALEISQSLPLITASRVLLMLLGAMLVVRRRDLFPRKGSNLKKLNLLLTGDKFLRISMFVYFILLFGVNVTFLLETSEAVKQLAVILAEEYLLVWLLTLTLDSREKIVSALKVMLLASAVCAMVVCISTVLEYNLFHCLETVRRKMISRPFYRYGVLRAAAGFDHPVYYGAYCAVMLPLGMYLVDHSRKKLERIIFGFCTAMTLVGLLLSNSRGSQLAFGCVAGLVFFACLFKRKVGKLLVTYVPVIVAAVAVVAVVFCLCPVGRALFRQNDVVPDPTVPPTTQTTDPTTGTDDPPCTTEPAPTESVPADTVPEIDTSFGENKNGTGSRLVQLTGIQFTLARRPVFGFGPNAHARGLIGYKYIAERWSYLKTVDVNIVAIVCQYGLVGLLGFLSLYGGMGISFLRKKFRGDPLMQYILLSFICYMLCLLSISFLNKWFWVLTGLFLSTVNVIGKKQSEDCE